MSVMRIEEIFGALPRLHKQLFFASFGKRKVVFLLFRLSCSWSWPLTQRSGLGRLPLGHVMAAQSRTTISSYCSPGYSALEAPDALVCGIRQGMFSQGPSPAPAAS
jgi:hypothetical protein